MPSHSEIRFREPAKRSKNRDEGNMAESATCMLVLNDVRDDITPVCNRDCTVRNLWTIDGTVNRWC